MRRGRIVSVQGISANAILYPSSMQIGSSAIGSEFSDLANALQSGDLKSAQNAFSQIESLMKNIQSSQGATAQQASGKHSQLSADFDALGKALQSGDMNAAQAAFKKLGQDMQSTGKAHHHHGGGGPSQATTPSTTISSTTSSTGNGDSSGTNINVLL